MYTVVITIDMSRREMTQKAIIQSWRHVLETKLDGLKIYDGFIKGDR